LLDEPTNHLDLTAKEVLLEALLGYAGTLVIVAHDRYLLDRLPTQVIEVGTGHAARYLGNYEDYLASKARPPINNIQPPAAKPTRTARARKTPSAPPRASECDRRTRRRAAAAEPTPAAPARARS